MVQLLRYDHGNLATGSGTTGYYDSFTIRYEVALGATVS